jgi:radical SAM superfamily enzyme YgiQ (UPF0313 family)
MRILLVQAWEKGCAETNFLSPPLGIWRLKSYLDAKNNNVMIEVFDPNLYDDPWDELDNSGNVGGYDIVGFSPLYFTLENDLSLMFHLREKNPHALFIAGGQQACFDKESLFRNSPIQIIVAGEGEKPMLAIVETVETLGLTAVTGSLAVFLHVPGLYLKNVSGPLADGKTAHLPPLTQEEFAEDTFLTDFSKIPVDQYWNLLEQKYTPEQLSDETIRKKIYTIKPFTSSYCPFRCIFCSSTNFYKTAAGCDTKIASLDPDALYKYVKLLLENQPLTRTILFKDDNFFVRHSKKEIKEVLVNLKRLKEEYPYLSFAAKARIDTFSVQPELLEMCRDAGFFFISFGVESFSIKELKYMSKGIDPSTSKEVLKRAKEMGINSVAYVILSSPVTEIRDIFMTVEGCIDLLAQGNTVKVFPYLIPIPGSALANDEGIKDLMVIKKFRVPRSDVEIEKAVKVNPRDKDARELITEYENRLPEYTDRWKKILDSKHFVAEVSTLIKFKLLYEIAREKKLVETDEAIDSLARIESMMYGNTQDFIQSASNEILES